MGIVQSYVRSIPATPELLEETALPFPYGRLILGKRHCRVLILGNINSDAIGIDINQPLWNRPESLFAPQEKKIQFLWNRPESLFFRI